MLMAEAPDDSAICCPYRKFHLIAILGFHEVLTSLPVTTEPGKGEREMSEVHIPSTRVENEAGVPSGGVRGCGVTWVSFSTSHRPDIRGELNQ